MHTPIGSARPGQWVRTVNASPPVRSPTSDGYWLSVDLLGPAANRRAAATALGEDLAHPEPIGPPPPGFLVGHVTEIGEAIRWVSRHAFVPPAVLPPHPLGLQRIEAPAPASDILRDHQVILTALIISGVTADLEPRSFEWPIDQSAVLPPGSAWIPAALVPTRAPLFAAPASSVPPAAEAYATVVRQGGLFVLTWVDRCEGQAPTQRCLRWAQVIARDGDRFVPGYLPMFQVARQSRWVRGELPLPRAQLIPTTIEHGIASWVLLARGTDNRLHRHTVQAPAAPDGWPRSSLRVDDDRGIIVVPNRPPIQLVLDDTLDARPPAEDSPIATGPTHHSSGDDGSDDYGASG